MNSSRMVLQRGGPVWLLPVVAGVVLVGVAFLAASYLIGPGSGESAIEQRIAALEAQVRNEPNSADLRVAVADAYLKAERPQEALVQYTEALALSDQREDAMFGMGLAYRALGDLDQAGAAFETIVANNQDNEMKALNRRLQSSHYYLGLTLREKGEYEGAVNNFRIALGMNRSDADTLVELGKTFTLMGEYEDAQAAFEIALAFVPDYEEAYIGLEGVAIASEDEIEAKYARAMLTVFDGKPGNVVDDLRGVAQQGDLSRHWWGLGYALEQTGDKEGAIAAYEASVEKNAGELLAAEALRRLKEAP